jgi:integrase
MAPNIRSYLLETRTQRAKLSARRKPYSIRIAPGIRVGYRRNEGAGTWSVICADGAGSSWIKRIALADDHEDADGKTIMDFWQATEAARKLARATDGESDTERPVTVKEAVEAYRRDLAARDGNEANATLLLPKLSPALASKPVSLLTTKDVLGFRDQLVASGIKKATVTRYMNAFLAALRLAARLDKRITNAGEWKLETLPNDTEARNVILPADKVRAVVNAAYEREHAFGLLVETIAVTGTRPSQALRLIVEDLLTDKLMIPRSRKGRGKRRTEKKPVPITPGLAAKLRDAAASRPANAPLLVDAKGVAWQPDCQTTPFRLVAKAAGLDPDEVTTYALRHSSIVRQLLANVPIRVVASHHDTSVEMIEKHYSKYITEHSEALTRRALLDIDDNVVPIQKKLSTAVR